MQFITFFNGKKGNSTKKEALSQDSASFNKN